ncbi:T9SS type B sorting domain-containing protein [Pseudofulvibacter geojedonensis]|uniref:Gliding motility-associated C-terminal domain-containing protein n=1 Tax=Pseudofulvibacter geojedonensis TaxID=1123758 RepID=A0ABW3HZ02_9FLAO
MIKIIKPLLALSILLSCSSSDNDETPEEDTFLCCGENPFQNINNLNEGNEVITVYEAFTPNGDGLNDFFGIRNIELYNNTTVSIYDLNDNLVFEIQNYASTPFHYFSGYHHITNEELPFGSYKYKIVVENEQTYLNQGYLCIIRHFSDANGHSFNSCIDISGIDPLII